MTEEQNTAIIAALAGDILDEVRTTLADVVPFLEEKLQFLINADIIDGEDDGENLLRGALHVAIDFALEEELTDEEPSDENYPLPQEMLETIQSAMERYKDKSNK
jgi:hypothetical protein